MSGCLHSAFRETQLRRPPDYPITRLAPLHSCYGPVVALSTLTSCRYLHQAKTRSSMGRLHPLSRRESHPLNAPGLPWRTVVFREVLEEQAQAAQGGDVEQMGVVDDGCEHLASLVDAVGFLDEPAFAAHVDAVGLDLKGLAQDSQRAVVGVQGSVDDRGDESLRIVAAERVFDDALARPRLADDEAETALLAVDAKRVKNVLLLCKKNVRPRRSPLPARLT
jgi:hypothetical protein